MFFSAVSVVSLFEVDDNTNSSVGIGEKNNNKWLYALLCRTDAVKWLYALLCRTDAVKWLYALLCRTDAVKWLYALLCRTDAVKWLCFVVPYWCS